MRGRLQAGHAGAAWRGNRSRCKGKSYGFGAAEATPPIKKIIDKCVKVSAGTDATRVASYNLWVSLAWLVTGMTVGGLRLYPQRNCLDREMALRMWTENVTWFSNEG
jgi:predicted amidohydrolase YtcJ